jgi:ABC-type nickel/cobalt efflux system permease component RcnA
VAKATAVKLSSLPGVQVRDVAAALDIHPFMLSLWRKQVRERVIVTQPVRLLISIATYFLTLLVVAVVAFFAVILLAGPHAGLLPHAMEVVVLVLGWLSVLILPFWGAWIIWKRLGQRERHAAQGRSSDKGAF